MTLSTSIWLLYLMFYIDRWIQVISNIPFYQSYLGTRSPSRKTKKMFVERKMRWFNNIALNQRSDPHFNLPLRFSKRVEYDVCPFFLFHFLSNSTCMYSVWSTTRNYLTTVTNKPHWWQMNQKMILSTDWPPTAHSFISTYRYQATLHYVLYRYSS